MNTIFYYIGAGCVGAIIGSVITMLAHRLRTGDSIVYGRSKCTACGHQLRWFELIPIISFVLLRGACGACRAKIPVRYVLIETAMVVLFLLVWHRFVSLPDMSILIVIRDAIVVSALVFIFSYDAMYMEVHPGITIGAGVLAGLLSWLNAPYDWGSIVSGIILGVSWFLIQFILSKGRWIGGGDIMIGFLMGATLGLWKTVVALGIAYVVGASYGSALLVTKKKGRKDEIAFGTFLAIGTVIALFWGGTIIGWYRAML